MFRWDHADINHGDLLFYFSMHIIVAWDCHFSVVNDYFDVKLVSWSKEKRIIYII